PPVRAAQHQRQPQLGRLSDIRRPPAGPGRHTAAVVRPGLEHQGGPPSVGRPPRLPRLAVLPGGAEGHTEELKRGAPGAAAAAPGAPLPRKRRQTVPFSHHQSRPRSALLSTCWWSVLYVSRPENPQVSAFW